MTFVLFLVSLTVVMGLLTAIIWWRSPLSFEGFGLLLVAPAILGDHVGITMDLFQNPGWVADRAIEDRIFPNFVFAVGLLALAAGLWIIDRRPAPMGRVLSEAETSWIKGWTPLLVVLGLGMKALALYVSGVGSLSGYLDNLGEYRVAQGQFGGFLDLGTGIALLGLAILTAIYIRRTSLALLLLLSQVAISFLLSFSKADLVGVVTTQAYVALILVPNEVRDLLRRPLVVFGAGPVALLAVIANAGIKSQFRGVGGDTELLDFSFSNILAWAGGVFGNRFSSEGVYVGYANMVNRITDGYWPFFDGKVLRYTLTSWVPYVLMPEKEIHPFRDVGQLFFNDYHSQATETSAPNLMGSAYVDYGFASLISYVFVYGVIIALLRVLLARPGRHPYLLLAYLHFTMVDGSGNILHGGITNLMTTFFLTFGVFVVLLGSIYLSRLVLGPQWERLEMRRRLAEASLAAPASGTRIAATGGGVRAA